MILPLRQTEIDFIRLIREDSQIKPELITDNKDLINAVKTHPLVRWKAMNANKNSN